MGSPSCRCDRFLLFHSRISFPAGLRRGGDAAAGDAAGRCTRCGDGVGLRGAGFCGQIRFPARTSPPVLIARTVDKRLARSSG